MNPWTWDQGTFLETKTWGLWLFGKIHHSVSQGGCLEKFLLSWVSELSIGLGVLENSLSWIINSLFFSLIYKKKYAGDRLGLLLEMHIDLDQTILIVQNRSTKMQVIKLGWNLTTFSSSHLPHLLFPNKGCSRVGPAQAQPSLDWIGLCLIGPHSTYLMVTIKSSEKGTPAEVFLVGFSQNSEPTFKRDWRNYSRYTFLCFG